MSNAQKSAPNTPIKATPNAPASPAKQPAAPGKPDNGHNGHPAGKSHEAAAHPKPKPGAGHTNAKR